MAKMTLEKLARMMVDGFKDTHGRIDVLDARMGVLDGRMGRLEGRMDRIEGEVRELRGEMTNWRITMDDHQHRIERLEKKTGIAS